MILLALFLAALGSKQLATAFRAVTGIAIVIGLLIACIHGYKDDGLFGAWWFNRHPLGSAIDPTSRPKNPGTLALIWLVGLAVILNVILLIR